MDPEPSTSYATDEQQSSFDPLDPYYIASYPEDAYSKLAPIPMIISCKTAEERNTILIEKLRQAETLFNSDYPFEYVNSKKVKYDALQELLEFVLTNKIHLHEIIYAGFFRMFEENIFQVPANKIEMEFEASDKVDELAFDYELGARKLVLEILHRFLLSDFFEPVKGSFFIGKTFISKLLVASNHQNFSQREWIKKIAHTIFLIYPKLRSFSKALMKNIFTGFVDSQTGVFHGIPQILDLAASFVDGFKTPLKEDNIKFLLEGLVPLHSRPEIAEYHPQLTYILKKYIQKDQTLCVEILDRIFDLWPKGFGHQVVLLYEIKALMEADVQNELWRVQTKLFQTFAKCAASSNFLISRAAHSWMFCPAFRAEITKHLEWFYKTSFNIYYAGLDSPNGNVRTWVKQNLDIFRNFNTQLYDKYVDLYNSSLQSRSTSFIRTS